MAGAPHHPVRARGASALDPSRCAACPPPSEGAQAPRQANGFVTARGGGPSGSPSKEIDVRKASNHGLGLYRSPMPRNPAWRAEWPEWADVVWRGIIAAAEQTGPGPELSWFTLPAVSQLPISSPVVL